MALSTSPVLRIEMEPASECHRDPSSTRNEAERRLKPRINLPYLATVRGVDATGEEFELHTLLDNFSAGGLYLRMPRRVEPGTNLFMVVHLSHFLTDEQLTGRVAIRGVVVRAEPKRDALHGVAVRFTHHRFL